MCKIPGVGRKNDFLLITASRRYKFLHNHVRCTADPKGHVFADRRLMLAEYDHFSSLRQKKYRFENSYDRIVYTESPNLRSFRQRLIMDCIKKRDLACFLLIHPYRTDLQRQFVLISLFSFSCHRLSFHVHERTL